MDTKHERPKHLNAGLIVKHGTVKQLDSFYKQGGRWYNLRTNEPEYADEQTLYAKWCIDSETGIRRLLDLRTGDDITPE